MSDPAPDAAAAARRRTFAAALSREERVLVLVRDELFAGSWDDLERDLRARLERRPSIIKLTTRIEEDLERIAKLRDFERAEGIDLRGLLPGAPPPPSAAGAAPGDASAEGPGGG